MKFVPKRDVMMTIELKNMLTQSLGSLTTNASNTRIQSISPTFSLLEKSRENCQRAPGFEPTIYKLAIPIRDFAFPIAAYILMSCWLRVLNLAPTGLCRTYCSLWLTLILVLWMFPSYLVPPSYCQWFFLIQQKAVIISPFSFQNRLV